MIRGVSARIVALSPLFRWRGCGGIALLGLVYMVRGDEHVEVDEKEIFPWFEAGNRMEGGVKKILEDMLDKK